VTDGRKRSLATQIALPFVVAALLIGIGTLLLLVTGTESGATGDRIPLAALATWTLASVSLFTALAVLIAHRLSSRLRVVSEGARRVAEGDYSVRVDVPANTEIGELASGFNDMALALEERSESLTRKVLDLSTLHESSRVLGSTLELDSLLERALDSALRVCGADTGYVTMLDGEAGTMEIRARRGFVPGHVGAAEIRTSMAGWVMRESRPLIVNPSRDDEGAHADTITGAVAAMCVPLLSADGPIGTVTVGTRDGGVRFGSDDVRVLGTIANHVTTAIGTIEAFNEVHDSYLATVRSLAAAVDAKDPYTRGHSDRVAHFATLAAAEMGLTHDQCMALEMAAYLHDIGKIGIPEDILLKPGRLSPEEMAKMRHHPLIGASILDPVSFPWPITPVVRHHHERWDGAGYPSGLEAAKIPLLARILSVADAYEAMIADRPYRAGRTAEAGMAELEACAGSQFDPEVVAAFTAALNGGLGADASITATATGPGVESGRPGYIQ
jgi:putative nucleotidyltransferase with HDIG domain